MAVKKGKYNQIFLGCNYGPSNNAPIKKHFESLKAKWEEALPIKVVLLDKEPKRGAQDLWKQITKEIDDSELIFLDLSSFRPNVVLELGYALANKKHNSIVISFNVKKRKDAKSAPRWELSDIPHLTRIEYKSFKKLDIDLEQNLANLSMVKQFSSFKNDIKASGLNDKNISSGLQILRHLIKHNRSITDTKFRNIIAGSSVRFDNLKKFLIRHNLVYRTRGANGRWYIYDCD